MLVGDHFDLVKRGYAKMEEIGHGVLGTGDQWVWIFPPIFSALKNTQSKVSLNEGVTCDISHL